MDKVYFYLLNMFLDYFLEENGGSYLNDRLFV